MRRTFQLLFVLGILILGSLPRARADETQAVYETEIAASVGDVWQAFTTDAGLRTWMAPLVEIDLTVGGKMKSNYDAKGKIGDAKTIENTILSFDPKRMLSLKATKYPEGFQFAEAAKGTWSVFYFTEVAPMKTKVTVVGLGYNDSEASQKMRAFFEVANKYSFDKLKQALQSESPATNSK